jgi:hypothetical protein
MSDIINGRDTSSKARSQANHILEYMLQGGRLTPLEALNKFGSFRLGARIWDLKRKGYDVKRRLTKVNGKKVAEYWIEPVVN